MSTLAEVEYDAEKGAPIPQTDDDVRHDLEHIGEETPLLAKKMAVSIGNLWMTNKKDKFHQDLQLALRGAVFVTIVGFPFVFPKGHISWLDNLTEMGLYNTNAVIMIVFTLYRSFGETVQLAWQGMAGTFVATLNIWLLFGFFPGGVSPTAPPHYLWCAIANGVCFIFLTLWLNFSLCSQIFAILWFAYHLMAFIAPGDDGFNHAFEMSTGGTAFSALMTSAVGTSMAILASLLPTPLLAIRQARDLTKAVSAETCAAWEHCARYYCSDALSSFEQADLKRDLAHLHESSASLHRSIENAWWECFGFGPWQRTRTTLKKIADQLSENHDRLRCLMNACLHETFEASHTSLMRPITSHISAVTDEARILSEMIVVAACSGGIIEAAEAQAMEASVARMRAAIKELTRAFHQAKRDTKMSEINTEQLDENAFCFNICAYGRLKCDVAEAFLAHHGGAELLSLVEPPAVLQTFDPKVLFDPQHLNFVARNWIQIMLCFIIGYFGPASTIRAHNADIAATAAILLSKHGGCGASKNLDRLQGLVLGTLIGQVVYAVFGSCTWWGYASLTAIIFLWTFTSLYMYYNSERYMTVGCLLAAFGSANFLIGCRMGDFKPTDTYFTVMNCVVAIFVITFTDMLLAGGRPSVAAYEAYLDFWKCLRGRVCDLLDPSVMEACSDAKATLVPKIGLCADLNMEALEEPRFWRTPWKKATYIDSLKHAEKLRVGLSGMSAACLSPCDCNKNPVFQKMLSLPSFDKIRFGVSSKMGELEGYIKIFVHETPDKMEELQNPEMMKSWSDEVVAAVAEFVEEAMACKDFSQDGNEDTLELDPFCEISLFLSNIDRFMADMRDLHHCFLAAS